MLIRKLNGDPGLCNTCDKMISNISTFLDKLKVTIEGVHDEAYVNSPSCVSGEDCVWCHGVSSDQ